jgi:DNA-binding MarR family transcriptional regulator
MTSSEADFRKEPEDDGIGTEASDIRALFSFTLQRLASLSTKIATRSVYEPYGLSIPEWRVLAVLGYLGEVSVLTVAKHSAVLRTQLPKVTSELEKRGLVCRKPNPEDARSALLSLTETGRSTVDEILRRSRARNRAMLADLSREERKELMRLVRKVIRTSRDHLDNGHSG